MTRRSAVAWLLLAGLALSCGRDQAATASSEPGASPARREVRVVPAAEVRVPRTVAITGTPGCQVRPCSP